MKSLSFLLLVCLDLLIFSFMTNSKEAASMDNIIKFSSDKSWLAYAGDPLESEQSLGSAQLVKLRTDSPAWASPEALVYGHWAGGWNADLSAIPNAHWIWAPGVTPTTSTNLLHTVFFTKQFNLLDYPLKAELYIAADDFAQVIVNNQAVGTIGSITDPAKAGQAQSVLTKFDISQFLVKGSNTITIRAQNGFVKQWEGNYSHNPAGVVFGGSISFNKDLPTKEKIHAGINVKLNNDPGLVAYYPFNNNADDMSGNNNNGVIYGAIASKDRHGKDKSAYYFNGKDSYIVVPNPVAINSIYKAISLALWINLDEDVDYHGYTYPNIISKGATYANLWADFGLGINKDIIVFEQTNQANHVETFSSLQTLPRGSWHHLVATFQENLINLYLDGKLIKTEQSPYYVFRSSSQPLYIGGRYINPLVGVFKGSIDDVRIYNRVLSDKDVLSLYNNEE